MRKRNIQKDIRNNVDYQTKYLGRGRLIKKNKVLISVLTTSAFLFPAVFVSAESVSIDKNNSNPLQMTNFSTLLKTDVVEFPAEFNSFKKGKGSSSDESTAKSAKVDRFVYGNFSQWQYYKSWGDDRQFSTLGNATVAWKTVPNMTNSGYVMQAVSTNANDGFMWNLNLMPNTNYQFMLQNTGSDFSKLSNGQIVITDKTTGTELLRDTVGSGKQYTYNFSTLPSGDFSNIDVKIIGVMKTLNIGGDFYFTATNPVLKEKSVEGDSFYKLSDISDRKVKEVMVDRGYEFQDSANKNSPIPAAFDTSGDIAINESTVGKSSKVFTGKTSGNKWGVSTSGTYSMTVVNDIQVLKDVEQLTLDTIDLIDKDLTLTQTEKDLQKERAREAGSDAKDAVVNSKSKVEFDTEVAKGQKNIKDQHKPGMPITDQKTKAVADIDQVIANTKAKIDADKNLTNEEKNAQKLKVDEAGNAAKTEINKATTADGLQTAVDTGTKNIEKEYKPGKDLTDQKDAALANLDKVIKDTKAAIEADNNLTTAEKVAQIKAVDEAGKVAKEAISKAGTAENLKVAVDTGTKNIENKYKPGKELTDQKNQAKESLDKVVEETKAAIENDPTLTSEQKAEQKLKVDEVAKAAKESLDNAKNADELTVAVDLGTDNIKAEHKSGALVDNQKNQAKENLDKVIKETKAAIENDPTLTTAEKEKQKNDADEAGKVAKEAVDQATTADQIKTAVDSGTAAIIKEHIPGNGLDVRKESAKDLIDKEVANTKKAIENDSTLTAAEKEKQIQAAIAEGETAKKAIDAATDANGIDSETAKGIEKVANQHQSGDALDTRKEDAKKVIDEEAKAIKEKIANDPTLTKEEKELQSGKVDEEAATAKKAIDAATTADGVDEAKGKGIELIDNQYQPGSPLVGRKDDAKKAIDEEAKVIKEKIANDPTLTKEEKDLQSGKVDEAATKAKEAIDAAVDASGVDEAKGKGIELIDNQHKPGSSLDGRKESAKNTIDQEATFTKEQIANDPTLTDAEKAEQAGKVDEEATKAKTAIDAATTADGIAEAKGKGIELVDNQYQPGEALNSRKDDAKKVIEEEVALIKERINNDPTLTAEEKATQSAGVDAAAEDAKKVIDAATDASGVDSAKGKGIELIDNQYQPGEALNSRKDSAKEAIDREATFTKEQIANDPTLTDAEKATQINGVDQEVTNAKSAIEAATDASGVDSAKGKGIELIDNQYQPGVSIIDRKESAKEAINQEAALTKERINNDPTLTDEEKVEQAGKVDEAAINAKAAIDGATDANGVDSSKGQGITNIDNQYETKQPLEERKEAAKARIDEAANAAKDKIANDPTLTDAEKATQIAGVNQSAGNAKIAIDGAGNASGVDNAKGQGVTDIDSNYQPGTSLDGRKETAKAGIDETAKEAKEKINNDPTLTAEEKATQSAGVDTAAENAKTAIDAATDASGVDREKGQGITNIDNNYQPGSGLDTRKDLAKGDIDNAANATKEKINNDPTLTAEEKATQSAGVDAEATKAKKAIDAATDASGVDKAKGEGITKIDNNYQPGNPLDTRKETAKAGIDNAAKETKERIANDPTLTDKEKATQSAGVDAEATKAKKAIDAATDASGVDKAKGEGITKIDKEYQTGNALDGRKEDAKKAIDDEAKAIKEIISNDSTLTKEEKAKQVKGVDTAAEDAKKAIDAAKNADGVDSAKGEGITKIDNNYQPGSQLDSRKEDAKKAIDDAAKATKEKIDNDPTLTKEDKKKQNAAVIAEAKKAKEAIDVAKNADDVDSAKGQGVTNIDKQYQPGDALEMRKENAKKAIEDAANATKEAIAKDNTLTDKEKDIQTKAVEKAKEKALEALNVAKTAEEIDSAKGQGISDIHKQHESGKSINDQKEVAKKELETIADKTKEAINKDSKLTAKEKAEQIKAVDEALAKAKTAIDSAKDADGIAKAKIDSVTAIESQYKPGKSTSGGSNTGGNGSSGGNGTSSGGGYTSGTSGKTGYSALPKTGSESTGYLAGLIGFALSGLALLGFRKRRETEEE